MSKRKRLLFTLSLFAVMMVLSACGTEPITSDSTGFWDRYVVFNFSNMIVWLSDLFFSNYGLGIIAFTIIIRVILLPLNHFQTKSTKKMSAVQPQIKALQAKYASKDRETQEHLQKEVSKLYADNDVNPYMGCLPVLVQMPVLMALYQAISRTEILKSGSFLWMNLGRTRSILHFAGSGRHPDVCYKQVDDDVTDGCESRDQIDDVHDADHDFDDGYQLPERLVIVLGSK